MTDTEKAIKQDREFVAQVTRALAMLPGDIKQKWIEHPKGLEKVLALALSTQTIGRHERPELLATRGQSWREIRETIESICNIDLTVVGMLSLHTVVASGMFTIVYRRLGELGLNDITTTYSVDQIIKAARPLGFLPFPPELVMDFRKEYLNQPFGEALFLAMNPLRDPHRSMGIFEIGRNYNGLYVAAVTANGFTAEDEFVLVKPLVS